ncbi:hypothetical protein BK659_26210 [Pseudomonas brassicacearum]|uniref:Uncharacterized protein n=1 Tax=Pseudomonas brassicacearum TaxID=930166 RepID=A0A423GWK3_9PSED|nr:hypothetical protein [Pseudomonas brassicacearum]RON02005.1 hypothetical protein BK659_26210 [Pseudomonas brassicacearum]
MSTDEIKGRNLITAGRFPSDWTEYWPRLLTGGNARTFADDYYGYYLIMNGNAAVIQTVNTAPLTTAQMINAQYRLSFQYQNFGGGSNSKVVVRPSTGREDPIDLSGKLPVHPEADWNPFTPYDLTVVAEDENLAFELHGSDMADANGLRITDFDVQLHLTPLTLSKLEVDDRVYSTSSVFQSITINGVPIDDLHKPDLVFFRADTHVLELQPKSGGPLPGMKVALFSENLSSDLGITITPALGESNAQDILENGSVKWTITGGNKSGFFDLQFKFIETDEVFPLPCRVVARHALDELDKLFNGKPVAWGAAFYPARNGTSTLTLKPKPGSSIRDDQIALEWNLPPTGSAVTITPTPGSPQPIHPTEGVSWVLKCSDSAVQVLALDAVFTHLSLEPLILTVIVRESPHKIHFMSGRGDQWDPMPGPPESVYGSSTVKTDLPVRVTTTAGVPCEGFRVTYTIPGFPTESGVSDSKGFARYPTPILFPEGGEFKLLAETSDLHGNVIPAIVQLLTT